MAIFSRRSLQLMVSELSRIVDSSKTKDWVGKLEGNSTRDVLATEAEVSFLWALSKTTEIAIEPNLGTEKRLEATAENFFPFGPAVFEVRAVSDDGFSDQQSMQKTAQIIVSFVNSLRSKAGNQLSFRFLERRGWNERGFNRTRCVDANFSLNEEIKRQIESWIQTDNWDSYGSIRISDSATDVVVSRLKNRPLEHNRVSSSVPTVAYDLEKNPVYKALKKKSEQLSNIDHRYFRCVVLYDAGCYLLQRLKRFGQSDLGADQIISHALKNLHIDSVVVFSPSRNNSVPSFMEPVNRDKYWKVTFFDKQSILDPSLRVSDDYHRLSELAGYLPKPNFEAYQARSLKNQGLLTPGDSFTYLPSEVTDYGDGSMSIKVSSRLLLNYIAGEIEKDDFEKSAFGKVKNPFLISKERGLAIRDVTLKEAGLDEDDDYIEFKLDVDWSLAKLGSRKDEN